MAERLNGATRRASLRQLHGWAEVEDRDAIRRSFHFDSFVEAFGFLTRVALLAEKMDHHPDFYNSYNRVEIQLCTHAAGGVTLRDIELAQRIDELAPARDQGPVEPVTLHSTPGYESPLSEA